MSNSTRKLIFEIKGAVLCTDFESAVNHGDLDVPGGNLGNAFDIKTARYVVANDARGRVLAVKFLEGTLDDTDDLEVIQVHGGQSDDAEREDAEKRHKDDEPECGHALLAPTNKRTHRTRRTAIGRRVAVRGHSNILCGKGGWERSLHNFAEKPPIFSDLGQIIGHSAKIQSISGVSQP